MRYFIITFGCQMNRSDSERIASVLESAGYKSASKINEADLIVVNMCSVRKPAVDRIYGVLPRLRQGFGGQAKPKTILTGCILKKDRKKFAEKFDYILDIKDVSKWPEILGSNPPLKTDNYLKIEPKYSNNFSAFVPIMTGCNNFCAYCVVPYARGSEISRPAEEIICEVENLIKRGYKEIWLLGQNVNSYNSIPFSQLLKKINDIPGEFWIRFTSSHPKPSTRAKLGAGPVPQLPPGRNGAGDFSWDKLIETMAKCKKVTEYLNLPVQSGDNKILKKMNRPYTIEHYKNLVKKIREKIPNIALSTDIIVGFPGETEKQFENTIKLFKEIKFDMAYIVKYSPRPGTAAAKMEDAVPQKERDRREKVLTEILKKTALENNKKYINEEVKVLVEKQKAPGSWIAKTRTHKNVQFESKENLLGQFVKIKITNALPWGLKGEIL